MSEDSIYVVGKKRLLSYVHKSFSMCIRNASVKHYYYYYYYNYFYYC